MVFGYQHECLRVNFGWWTRWRGSRAGFKAWRSWPTGPNLYPPDVDEAEFQRLEQRWPSAPEGDQPEQLHALCGGGHLFALLDRTGPSPQGDPHPAHARLPATSPGAWLRQYIRPPGGPLSGVTRREAERLFHDGLEQVIPLAEELCVRILVEPEPGLMIETTRQFQEFMRGVRSAPVGLNFDIGHFFCAGEDPVEAFETLFEWGGTCIWRHRPTRVHQHFDRRSGGDPLRGGLESHCAGSNTPGTSAWSFIPMSTPQRRPGGTAWPS